MFWIAAVFIGALVVSFAMMPKPMRSKPPGFDELQVPTAEVGREIPVLFGTRDLNAPNVTWYGDLRTVPVKKSSGGLFGKKQTVGYRYYLGQHHTLCHGPWDKLVRVSCGEKIAWEGNAGAIPEIILVDAAELFGGQDREGGVHGDLTIYPGYPDQLQDSYLLSKVSAEVPAYRGVVSLVQNQMYQGNNPYLKAWSYRGSRIYVRQDGITQWYPAKAGIPDNTDLGDDTGIVLQNGQTMNRESKLDSNGEWGAWCESAASAGNTFKVWHLPDGAEQSASTVGYSLGGAVHITDFDEVVVRSGGTFLSGPTTLEFREAANISNIISTVNLGPVTGTGVNSRNFGFVMDDSAADGGHALVQLQSGVEHWVILSRSGGSWSIDDSHAATFAVETISIGPTYAYCVRSAADDKVGLIRWNGSWSETAVAPPGFPVGGVVRCVHYNSSANEVAVVGGATGNGGIYVYNADMTTLLRSVTGYPLATGTGIGSPQNSKRMSSGRSIYVGQNASSALAHIYEFNITDLSIVRDIVPATVGLVEDQNFDWMYYNSTVGGAMLGHHFFETVFWPIAPVAEDMNPAHIIREGLTDPDWGMGYQETDIDDTSFELAADTLYSEGLGMSLLWDRQITIEEFVNEVIKHIDAALYVSRTTGKFVLKLIRGDYDPDTLIHLNESNITKVSNPSRAGFNELVNSISAKFWNKATGKDDSVTVFDTALVQMRGQEIGTTVQYPGFTRVKTTTIAAQRDLRTMSQPFLSCTIYADSTARVLNVGDTFKFSWSRWQVSEMVMRVVGIAYGDGKNNQVKVTCTQDIYATESATVITGPSDVWEDPVGAPTAVTNQMGTELPYYELVQLNGQSSADGILSANANAGFVVAAAEQPGSAINAELWASPGSGYTETGALDFAPSGTLAAGLAILDTVVTISGGSNLDLIELGTHVQIEDELCRVDAIDTTTGALTIGRGILDTIPKAHAAGSRLYFWDVYQGIDPTEYNSGDTIDVKILPVTGSGVLPLSGATAVSVTLDQRALRPYPPANVQVNGMYYPSTLLAMPASFTWAHRDRTQQTSMPFADHNDASIGPEVGTTYTIRIYGDDGTTLLRTTTGITGTSWDYDATMASADGSPLQPWVEIESERDGLVSWQHYRFRIIIAERDALLFSSGDELEGTSVLWLSGDEQSDGNDLLKLSGTY